jgi:hypothetical protein
MTIECGRCEMRGMGCRDCASTVTETRNVTGCLSPEELRALGVLADAGMVPPLRLTIAGHKARPAAGACIFSAFPGAKAS